MPLLIDKILLQSGASKPAIGFLDFSELAAIMAGF
jgi:hypothetical protein